MWRNVDRNTGLNVNAIEAATAPSMKPFKGHFMLLVAIEASRAQKV
jgi:hypothetical protein